MRFPKLGWILALVFVAAMLRSAVAADEAEQVDALEKVAAQIERLNVSAKKSLEVLQQIKDPATADKAIKPLAAAVGEFAAESEAFVKVGTAADKVLQGGRVGRSQQYAARYEAAGKRNGAAIGEWGKLSGDIGREMKRILELKGLSAPFWNEMNFDVVRFGVALNKSLAAMGEPVDEPTDKFMSDVLALYKKHGAAKIVSIGLMGGSEGERAAAEQALQKGLGSGVTIISKKEAAGLSLVIAPVEKLSDATKLIVGKITSQEDARRRVTVEMPGTGRGFKGRLRSGR